MKEVIVSNHKRIPLLLKINTHTSKVVRRAMVMTAASTVSVEITRESKRMLYRTYKKGPSGK